MTDAVRSEGHVIGSKVSAIELEQIKKLVASALLKHIGIVRNAVMDKLAAIKTINTAMSTTRPPKKKF